MLNNTYDAIVVGSGISGGWYAKELTEKGLQVLMLEHGKNVEHIKDYTNTNKNLWDYLHRGRPAEEALSSEPNMARSNRYPFNEVTMGTLASLQTSPYAEKEPFQWFRAYQVGGRSLLWGRQSYRLNPQDFEAMAFNQGDHGLRAGAAFTGQPHYFTLMKQLIIFGFFSSNVGATQVLQHSDITGDYCYISYNKGDKAWTSVWPW